MKVEIRVAGDPKPQGSKSATVRGGRAVMYEASKGWGAWRAAVRAAARAAYRGPPLDGPVHVIATFFLPRPKSRKAERWAVTGYDLDKLCRAVGDGLEKGGVLSNDKRIVRWTASKYWADPQAPGVHLTIITGDLP